jgi:hypothetical protein
VTERLPHADCAHDGYHKSTSIPHLALEAFYIRQLAAGPVLRILLAAGLAAPDLARQHIAQMHADAGSSLHIINDLIHCTGHSAACVRRRSQALWRRRARTKQHLVEIPRSA